MNDECVAEDEAGRVNRQITQGPVTKQFEF